MIYCKIIYNNNNNNINNNKVKIENTINSINSYFGLYKII